MYSEKLLKHFRNPKNQGKLKDSDGVGKVGNPLCGDVMWFYIKVKNNRIVETGWETFGCAAAIATSSMISELAKGKTLKQAIKITKDDVSEALGGLPKIKQHCSNLAVDALHEAIYDYLSKRKQKIPKELEKMHKKREKILKGIHKH